MTLELFRGFVEMINLTHNHKDDDKINDKIWSNVPAAYCPQEILHVMNLYPSHRKLYYKTNYVAM
jgi:hypothetical protein